MKLLIGLVIGLMLGGTVSAYATSQHHDKTEEVGNDVFGIVDRFDDDKFQVKCWTFTHDRGGGISCLPWSEIKQR